MTRLDELDAAERHRLERSGTDALHLLGDIQSLVCAHLSIRPFLRDLAGLAVTQTGQHDLACRVVARPPVGQVLVGCSDPRATLLDGAEGGFDEGPACDVLVTGLAVDVTDWAAETRWPRYRQLTGSLGVVSSLSLPLVHRGVCWGSMTLYSFAGTGALAFHTRARFRLFVSHAAMSVVVMLRQSDLLELMAARVATAADRNDFDVATGIVMAQRSCTVTEAQEALRRAAVSHRALGTAVREVLDSVTPGLACTRLDAVGSSRQST